MVVEVIDDLSVDAGEDGSTGGLSGSAPGAAFCRGADAGSYRQPPAVMARKNRITASIVMCAGRPAISVSAAAMVLELLEAIKGAAYLPRHMVASGIDTGHLHPVPGAPSFALNVYSVIASHSKCREQANRMEAHIRSTLGVSEGEG